MPDSFRILTVCTGNICRSPLAKQLLEAEFQGDEQISIDSAGVQALVDRPMPEFSVEIAIRNGIPNPDVHRAKQLNKALLDSADLILAMDRGHRKSIVEMDPRSTRKSFTVRELARLIEVTDDADLQIETRAAGDDLAEKLRAAIEAVKLGRSDLPPLPDPEDDDVIDPYGGSQYLYEESAQQLIPAIRVIASYFKRAQKV